MLLKPLHSRDPFVLIIDLWEYRARLFVQISSGNNFRIPDLLTLGTSPGSWSPTQ